MNFEDIFRNYITNIKGVLNKDPTCLGKLLYQTIVFYAFTIKEFQGATTKDDLYLRITSFIQIYKKHEIDFQWIEKQAQKKLNQNKIERTNPESLMTMSENLEELYLIFSKYMPKESSKENKGMKLYGIKNTLKS